MKKDIIKVRNQIEIWLFILSLKNRQFYCTFIIIKDEMLKIINIEVFNIKGQYNFDGILSSWIKDQERFYKYYEKFSRIFNGV